MSRSFSTTSRPPRPTDQDVAQAAENRLVKIVDLAAIRHNLRVLRTAAGNRRVMVVLKGDAYGLGAVPIARMLERCGVDAIAVDTVSEGLALRAAGIRAPVLTMDVDVTDNSELGLAADLTPSIATVEHVRHYAELGRRRDRAVTAWLRTNVGFNRFGPRRDEQFGELLTEAAAHAGSLRVAALFTRLSSDAWNEQETARQAAAFGDRLAAARALLGPDVVGSLAGTHGLLHSAALTGTTWVRPGLGLYGLVHPASRHLSGWAAAGLEALRPAFEVRARVLDVVDIVADEGLGYDRSVPVSPGLRVASVAVGFSRGITSSARSLSGLWQGVRCRLIGTPGMDCTQFDVSHLPGLRPGDWLTLIGTSNGVTKSVAETCGEIGISLYELMSTLRAAVRIVDSDEPAPSPATTASSAAAG